MEAVEKKRKGQPGQGLFFVETDAYLNTAVGCLSIFVILLGIFFLQKNC